VSFYEDEVLCFFPRTLTYVTHYILYLDSDRQTATYSPVIFFETYKYSLLIVKIKRPAQALQATALKGKKYEKGQNRVK
jgi:hypothetical protein